LEAGRDGTVLVEKSRSLFSNQHNPIWSRTIARRGFGVGVGLLFMRLADGPNPPRDNEMLIVFACGGVGSASGLGGGFGLALWLVKRKYDGNQVRKWSKFPEDKWRNEIDEREAGFFAPDDDGIQRRQLK
jgi:hypothetical protein